MKKLLLLATFCLSGCASLQITATVPLPRLPIIVIESQPDLYPVQGRAGVYYPVTRHHQPRYYRRYGEYYGR